MTGFQKTAVATAAATFLLIGLGGSVRAAGAGLGCPDWPRCFGRWIPPTDASQLPAEIDPARFNFALAWTEYINRLAGVLVGCLVLATAASAWWLHRRRPRIVWPATAAVVLVAVQGWLGGQVVARELDPSFVTLHLLLALALGAILLHVAVEGLSGEGGMSCLGVPGPRAGGSRRVFWLVAAALGAVSLQVVLGAAVRGALESALAADPGLDRGVALGRVGAADAVHRSWAAVVLLLCAAVSAAAHGRVCEPAFLRRLARAPAGLAALQLAAGVGLAALDLPPALQVVHLVAGSLLFGTLVLLGLLLAPAGRRGWSRG